MLEEAWEWSIENLPVAVGGAVTVLLLGFMLVSSIIRSRARKRTLNPAKLVSAGGGWGQAVVEELALNWEPMKQSYADRRESVRREGQPVRVTLTASSFRNGIADGYVVDRSTGGLKIATQIAVAPGGVLQVRAVDAPDNIGFVTVIVRSCRKNDNYYEVGCEFEKTPPWNVLLLFG